MQGWTERWSGGRRLSEEAKELVALGVQEEGVDNFSCLQGQVWGL